MNYIGAKHRGFTLVEIIIVTAILALLAAIAIPILLRPRLSANEAAAIASTRTISTACESFRAAQTPPTYPPSLAALGSETPAYIDGVLAGGIKNGYSFAYTFVSVNQYICTATPLMAGVTGSRIFFVDESGVIRLNNAAGQPVE